MSTGRLLKYGVPLDKHYLRDECKKDVWLRTRALTGLISTVADAIEFNGEIVTKRSSRIKYTTYLTYLSLLSLLFVLIAHYNSFDLYIYIKEILWPEILSYTNQNLHPQAKMD